MKPENSQLEDSSAMNLDAMMACVAMTMVASALLMKTAVVGAGAGTPIVSTAQGKERDKKRGR